MTLLAASQAILPYRQRSVAFAQTLAGRLALVAVVTAMVAAMKMQHWWAIGIALFLTSLFPDRRKQIILGVGVAWVFLVPPLNFAVLREIAPQRAAQQWIAPVMWNPVGSMQLDLAAGALLVSAACAAFALLFAYGWMIRRFPTSPPARKPVLGLILLLLALFAVTQLPMPGLLWLFLAATAMAFNQYIWFFAFWIVESRNRAIEQALPATYAWRPFWGFTTVPFGKGATYLQSVEAKSDEELADTQLRGVKLLVLAALWTAVLIILKRFLFGPSESLTAIPHHAPNGRIPTYEMALDAMANGHPYPWAMRWAALAGYFAMWVLYFTIFGHKIVGIARVAGFNLYRNTYKPYLATSIADFYNRIYYYFKELLVAFFFYPTYLRYFKKRPKLRLFVATLAAAGFGNVLFHFLRTDERILRDGLIKTAIFFQPYIFYGLLLGGAISISQLRGAGRRKEPPTGLRRLIAIAGVWLFFCLICIIQEPNDSHGLRDYGHYFLSLLIP